MAAGKPVDVRADRTAEGAVTVIALGAFVFHAPIVIPVLAVILGVGALLGPNANGFHRLFGLLVAPRLSAATGMVPAETVQTQDLLEAALLGLATLCNLISLGAIGSIATLLVAGAAVVAATTGIHLGVILVERIRRR